jgi:hypothetical protein
MKRSLKISEFLKQKTNKNCEAYRKQRNFANKLKKKSVQKYFYERCDFWPSGIFLSTTFMKVV